MICFTSSPSQWSASNCIIHFALSQHQHFLTSYLRHPTSDTNCNTIKYRVYFSTYILDEGIAETHTPTILYHIYYNLLVPYLHVKSHDLNERERERDG
jgi:hypothetical protein